jgi:hypothetical protein
MSGRQKERLSTKGTAKLTECNDRAGKGNTPDKYAEQDLDLVDQFFGPDHLGMPGIKKAGQANQDGSRPDKAMENGDQLGHGGHLHPLGEDCPDEGATQHQGNQEFEILNLSAKESRKNGKSHPQDSVQVSLAGSFLLRKPAQAQDEKDT